MRNAMKQLMHKFKPIVRTCYIFSKTLFKKIFVPVFSAHSFLASLYYLFFSTSFRKEQHLALLATKYHLFGHKRAAYYRLRRNIHRLEKGLTVDSPKPHYAEGYILSAVWDYLTVKNYTNEKETICWASDVFEKYFCTVKQTSSVRKAYELFKAEEDASRDRIPYERGQKKGSSVSFDQFRQLCEQRCSTRYYEQKKVPRELIEKAIEAASTAPSACNRLPYCFKVYDDCSQIQNILKISYGVKTFSHNVHCLVLVCFDMIAFEDARDRHCGVIDGNLAAMIFMLALETLGLSSCPINWPEIKSHDKRLKKVIQLENTQRCIMMISVGYPKSDALIPYSAKKSIPSLVQYNV